MHDLAEVMEKSKEIKALKEKLIDCFKAELSTKGMDCIDTEEAGKVVDMIKDLAETEKECMEALYYQKVTEAMLSYDEPRYGYNTSRYKSSGRYAPKGSGTRMGFMPHTPYLDYDGEMDPEDYMRETMRPYGMGVNYGNYGYNGGSNGGSNGSNSGGSGSENTGRSGSSSSMGYGGSYNEMEDPRYGKAYNEYKMKRRHYTETKSQDDKRDMDMHAEEHVHDTISTVRDIWKDADPSLKKKMKEDFTKLVGEMTV